ncbi:N-acyl amino acid synthase FeeM domain-containing protein [Thermodesulfatator autotrophicus]|uniref:N-acyl amino acid synthase FeeM catalytic core domain-containing protein n=1 Tax=Thermodesulfatator autotrophicus TaxID=1795632 RepID=A0A177E4X1_9BACT|nr:hypothetical protein [Thermodesulfatator autotrophicus]OAG26955.1 hypothetical protein TH606_09405 [Thermodesulfatator autotrophicus]
MSENKKEVWRRRRRLNLSKVPECLTKRIVEVSFCSKLEEFEEAFSLLYDRYHEVGLIPTSKERLFFTPYQALPDSRVCVARSLETGEVTSTATLVIDSEVGLPSDSLYKDIIDKLRKEGRKPAEFTCLAAKTDIYSRNGLFYIFRILYKYAISKGVTDLVISVHPKHTTFYELLLLFERISPLSYYPRLKNAPAYLERLDLIDVKKRYEVAYSPFWEGQTVIDFFFHITLPEDAWILTHSYNMKRHIFKYFYIEKTNAFKKMDKKLADYLASIYLEDSDYQEKELLQVAL